MSAVPATINPFGGAERSVPASAHNAVAVAQQQREVAEVQGAIAIAKRFPRDQVQAMDRILQACTRPSLAESALYSYSRGGTDVTGPSIRLAETLAQCWGNIHIGIRELEQRDGESTVEAFAWDAETNVRHVKVFQVRHERHTKSGVKHLTDPRDVYELVANQGARRLRACILGVIPGDVTEAAVKQCETTMKTRIEITPELVKSLVDKFAEFGVGSDLIEKRIQRRLDKITPALVVQLGKIYTSMKDGMSQAADWFEVATPPPSTSEAVGDLNSRIKQARPAPRQQQRADEPPAPSYAQVRDAIEKAQDHDALDLAGDLIGSVADEGQRAELRDVYEQRRAALTKE